jgi:hypothetical protein
VLLDKLAIKLKEEYGSPAPAPPKRAPGESGKPESGKGDGHKGDGHKGDANKAEGKKPSDGDLPRAPTVELPRPDRR